MSQSAISTAALVNGLSLIRKSICLRIAVICGRVGTHQGRPDQVVERRHAALARLAAPERRDRRLAQTDQALIGVDFDDHVVRRVMVAVGRLRDHAGLSGTRTGIASSLVIRMEFPSIRFELCQDERNPPAAHSP